MSYVLYVYMCIYIYIYMYTHIFVLLSLLKECGEEFGPVSRAFERGYPLEPLTFDHFQEHVVRMLRCDEADAGMIFSLLDVGCEGRVAIHDALAVLTEMQVAHLPHSPAAQFPHPSGDAKGLTRGPECWQASPVDPGIMTLTASTAVPGISSAVPDSDSEMFSPVPSPRPKTSPEKGQSGQGLPVIANGPLSGWYVVGGLRSLLEQPGPVRRGGGPRGPLGRPLMEPASSGSKEAAPTRHAPSPPPPPQLSAKGAPSGSPEDSPRVLPKGTPRLSSPHRRISAALPSHQLPRGPPTTPASILNATPRRHGGRGASTPMSPMRPPSSARDSRAGRRLVPGAEVEAEAEAEAGEVEAENRAGGCPSPATCSPAAEVRLHSGHLSLRQHSPDETLFIRPDTALTARLGAADGGASPDETQEAFRRRGSPAAAGLVPQAAAMAAHQRAVLRSTARVREMGTRGPSDASGGECPRLPTLSVTAYGAPFGRFGRTGAPGRTQ